MAAPVSQMAKKKPEPTNPPDESAKIPADVMRMARIVVAVRGGSISSLIGNLARPGLAKLLKEIHERGELTPRE